jgi:hypothetical protein
LRHFADIRSSPRLPKMLIDCVGETTDNVQDTRLALNGETEIAQGG